MDQRTALQLINEFLGLGLGPTFKGDELKGMKPDADEGGTRKFYLGYWDCNDLAEAFAIMTSALREEAPRGALAHRVNCGSDCPKNVGTGPCNLG